MYAVPLVQHWRVQLYRERHIYEAHKYLNVGQAKLANSGRILDPETLAVNTKLLWDGRMWTLVNWGETTVTLLPEVGQPMQLPGEFFLELLDSGSISLSQTEAEPSATESVRCLMEAASPAALAQANRRFHLVQAYFQRQTDLYQDIVPRTLRRWVKRFREAEAQYGCGYVGLLPQTAKRGNRKPKAPQAARELLDIFIAEQFETSRQAPAISVYRGYLRACSQQDLQPLSERTFYRRVGQRTPKRDPVGS